LTRPAEAFLPAGAVDPIAQRDNRQSFGLSMSLASGSLAIAI
jgi:hypothetical protein